MAVLDKRRDNKFEQKRGVCVGSYELEAGDISASGSVVATFDKGVLITDVTVMELEEVNTGATFDLEVGAYDREANVFTQTDTIVDEGTLDSTNEATVVLTDLTTPKSLLVKAGDTAPTQGSVRLLVEYIEYNKTTGEYTRT